MMHVDTQILVFCYIKEMRFSVNHKDKLNQCLRVFSSITISAIALILSSSFY